MLFVGLSGDWGLDSAGAFGRAVAALCALRRGTVNLNQHPIVNVGAERAFNGVKICPVTIAGKLDGSKYLAESAAF